MSNPEAPQRLAAPDLAPETRSAWGLVAQLFVAPERKRLRAAIEIFRADLALTVASAGTSEQPWAQTALTLLQRAQQEARAGDLDSGWKFLHEARRQQIHGLTPESIETRSVALAHEADAKLFGWRKAAIESLLKTPPPSTSSIEQRRAALCAAMLVQDEHTDNVYFRNRLLRRQMTVIGAALVLLGAGFLALLSEHPTLAEQAKSSEFKFNLPGLLCAMALGGMGACFSALTMFASSSSELKIPAHLANVLITVTRPLIGAASGLVAYLLRDSGSLNLGPATLIVPFVFGFSERLVVGALGSFTKGDDKPGAVAASSAGRGASR